jgi:hypothetical protein
MKTLFEQVLNNYSSEDMLVIAKPERGGNGRVCIVDLEDFTVAFNVDDALDVANELIDALSYAHTAKPGTQYRSEFIGTDSDYLVEVKADSINRVACPIRLVDVEEEGSYVELSLASARKIALMLPEIHGICLKDRMTKTLRHVRTTSHKEAA